MHVCFHAPPFSVWPPPVLLAAAAPFPCCTTTPRLAGVAHQDDMHISQLKCDHTACTLPLPISLHAHSHCSFPSMHALTARSL
eukprot:1161288-Pelagomonas_calceolata.AAC.1